MANETNAPAPEAAKKPSTLKKILLTLVVLVVAFCIYAQMQPDSFKVERSTVINAPPEAVFAQVNDFHKWEVWSPWLKDDPNAKGKFEGPDAGKDASFDWVGNSSVGEGRMTIEKSEPNKLIEIRLDFRKPMAGTSIADFTFTPEGDGTKVVWGITGKKNFISKAMCVFMDMDKMIGGKFEEGLASIKKICEGGETKKVSE